MSTFHGEIGFAVDNWLRDAEDQFEFYGPSEFPDVATKLRFVKSYMRGAARDWWDSERQKDRIVSWEAFVERLHERFRPLAAADFARQRLLALKQKGSVSAYCNLFQKEMTPIKDMSEADQIFFFRHGLRADIAKEVKRPKTLHEAMDLAVRAEALDRSYASSPSFFAPRGSPGTAASAPRNFGVAPMDINNIEHEQDTAESDVNAEPADSGDSREAPASNSSGALTERSNPQLLAMIQEMRAQQQQLFAMFQSRDRPRPGGAASSAPRVPDVCIEED